MNNLKVLFLFVLIAFSGCNYTKRYETAQDGSTIRAESPLAREFCYKGVVYVWFNAGDATGWGTVRLDRETGNVVKCGIKQ